MGLKWGCSCGKRFRHEYLLYRHVDVANKSICPMCFTPFRFISGDHSEIILHCPGCRYQERYTSKEAFSLFKGKANDRHHELEVDRTEPVPKTPVKEPQKVKP